MITVEIENGLSRLSIEGEMTIATALEQRQSILQPLAECDEMEINLSRVSALDVAGLQLLLLVQLEAAETNKKVSLVEPSAALLEIFDHYKVPSQHCLAAVLPARKIA